MEHYEVETTTVFGQTYWLAIFIAIFSAFSWRRLYLSVSGGIMSPKLFVYVWRCTHAIGKKITKTFSILICERNAKWIILYIANCNGPQFYDFDISTFHTLHEKRWYVLYYNNDNNNKVLSCIYNNEWRRACMIIMLLK